MKNPILELYILKEAKSRIEAQIERRRGIIDRMAREEASDEVVDQFALKVKFGTAKGTKTFNMEKAIAFLRTRLKSRFNQYFRRWEIERRPGADEPPPELLEEMKKYFTVKSVAEVEESKLRTLPLGLSDAELEENCYDHKPPVNKMYTPTDVSAESLIEFAEHVRIDMTRLLLEEPK